eukprot:scaffold308719_cov18-Prasinocladus_malaysianus.AAC.1
MGSPDPTERACILRIFENVPTRMLLYAEHSPLDYASKRNFPPCSHCSERLEWGRQDSRDE